MRPLYFKPQACRIYSNRGISLVEALLSLVIIGIVGFTIASLNQSLFQFSSETSGKNDVEIYAMELKSHMKSMNYKGNDNNERSDSYCRATLVNVLTPLLGDIVSNSKKALDTQDELNLVTNGNPVNFLDMSSTDYGNLSVQKSVLKNFKRLYEGEGFMSGSPTEFIPKNNNVVGSTTVNNNFFSYIIQADLIVSLAPKSDLNKVTNTKPVKVRFSIESRGGYTLLDCGHKSLAQTIVKIETCKALGEDFIFVYDQFDGDANSGQCYAPRYKLANSAVIPNYNVNQGAAPALTYVPLRAFFCNLTMQGKGFDFPYCTGFN